MKNYDRKTHIKTLVGILDKNKLSDWEPYYAMYSKGISLRKLSSVLGMCHKSLRIQFQNLGFKIFNSKDYYFNGNKYINKNSTDYWEPYYNMYREGSSLRDIATLLQYDKSSIKTIFENLGFSTRDKKSIYKNISNKKIYNYSMIFEQELHDEDIELIGDYMGAKNEGVYIPYTFKHNTCGTLFTACLSGNYSLRCPKCNPSQRSLAEDEISSFIKNEGFGIEVCNRSILNGLELDIYLPELNVGFEYNGTYWHCSKYLDSHYHKVKTDLATENNIKLYHIWEHDDNNIVKSLIKNKLGKIDNRYYARKLKIKEVDSTARKEFFNSNHLHGDVKSKISLGLYEDNQLITCISFRSHKEGIEIARFASKINSCCIGGFSRLLKHSIPILKEIGYNKIITYCDRDWTPRFYDSVYYKNGFSFVKNTGCSFNYTDGNKLYSRETFQKHKLKSRFPHSYSATKTANEILAENNIYSIYNSGNWKYELNI